MTKPTENTSEVDGYQMTMRRRVAGAIILVVSVVAVLIFEAIEIDMIGLHESYSHDDGNMHFRAYDVTFSWWLVIPCIALLAGLLLLLLPRRSAPHS